MITRAEVEGPKWIQLLVVILKTSGPVAVIAFVLVYFLMKSVTGDIGDLSKKVDLVHTEISSAKVEMHAFAAANLISETERAKQYGAMLQVLRQMCVNTADNAAARAGCYVEGK